MHEFCLSEYIGIIVVISLATEAIIEIIKTSDISILLVHSRIIPRYEQNPTWYNYTLYKWITCGQCMSVIYSIPGATFLSIITHIYYLPFSFIVFLFVIQRVTNWLNSAYKLLYRGRVVAIELLSPLINVSNEMAGYNAETLLSEARERSSRRGGPQTVIIQSIADIKRTISNLKTEKPEGGRIVNVEIGGNTFNVNTSTKHPSYMKIISDAFSSLSEEEPLPEIIINGEKLVPLSVGQSHVIDEFIKQCAGGVRDGNRIKWELQDGYYFYDPVADKLTMKDKESSDL